MPELKRWRMGKSARYPVHDYLLIEGMRRRRWRRRVALSCSLPLMNND